MQLSVEREGRASRLLVQGKSQGLLVRMDFGAATIKAKVRSGLPISQNKRFVISIIMLNI